jgi:hypothetical protein
MARNLRRLVKKVELQEAWGGGSFTMCEILEHSCITQANIIREATLGPFPRCWHCDSVDEVVYAQRGKELYYCGPCWQHFLANEGTDWERCRSTLMVANPEHCHKCNGSGPYFIDPNESDGSWLCAPCWGEGLPSRSLQYPSPLLQMPTTSHHACSGLVASDYRIVSKNCGIWPTVERNVAILRQGFCVIVRKCISFRVVLMYLS